MDTKPNNLPIEIERKFLVNKELWSQVEKGLPLKIRQGYIHTSEALTIRVRTAGREAFLTIKGKTTGIRRSEFEYAIPLEEAEEMIVQFCGKVIEKYRYKVSVDQHVWDVDVFHGKLHGLVIAEIELKDESEHFTKPEWLKEDVSHDPQYYNAVLIDRC
jgi:adenylate cyclase